MFVTDVVSSAVNINYPCDYSKKGSHLFKVKPALFSTDESRGILVGHLTVQIKPNRAPLLWLW